MLLWIIGVFFYCLILVVVCWIFYPVIACRNEKQKPNEAIKLDNFYNAKGIIAEKGQIFSPSKCDISVVVPAYNEVGAIYCYMLGSFSSFSRKCVFRSC